MMLTSTGTGSPVGRARPLVGVRFVLLSQLLLWARRQSLDLSLRGLLILVVSAAFLSAALLPGLGAAVGFLAAGGFDDPVVAVGLVLLTEALWSAGRLVSAAPASRRLAVQRPPDRAVFETLGCHPSAIRTALAVVPACTMALAAGLTGLGALVGVATFVAGPGAVNGPGWLVVLVLPIATAVAETRVLCLPVQARRPRLLAAAAAFVGGWVLGTVVLAIGTEWAWTGTDELVLALVEAIGLAMASAAPLLLAAAMVLLGAGVVVRVPEAGGVLTPGVGLESVQRPNRRVLRLSLRRGSSTAIATHRRLSRVVQLVGLVALGVGLGLFETVDRFPAAAGMGVIAVFSAVSMALAISSGSGLGLRCLEGPLRWLHDAGLPAPRVVGTHLAEMAVQLLGAMAAAILAAGVLAHSPAVAAAAVAVTLGAVAAASLGDLLDATRTAHADGSGESGLLGGLVTALIQAALTAPWALLSSAPATALVVGFGAPIGALVLTAVIAVRRIHP